MKKYIILHGNKNAERASLANGFFMVWTEKNVKNAFSFGNGTMKDFNRFAKDNAGNTTCIDMQTMQYIDTGKESRITKKEIENAFYNFNIM